MEKISCQRCKGDIWFPEYIGRDFEGDLKCDLCDSLYGIKLVKGKLKELHILWIGEPILSEEERERLQNIKWDY